MRKLGLVFAVLLVLSCFALRGQASVLDLSDTYVFTNTKAYEVIELVSTTTIIPGVHKILAVTVIPYQISAYSPNVALYDAIATDQLSENNILGENEAPANESKERIFPYPKALARGLALAIGPYTTVIIDYSR